jgi:hypothetical protein
MMITPFKVFLSLMVVLVICFWFDSGTKDVKLRESVKVTGGLTFLLIILDIIWGIFYYINI